MNPPDEVPESTVNGQTRTVESVTRGASKPRRKDKGQAHHMISQFLNLRFFFHKILFFFAFLQGRSFLLKQKMPMYLFILTEKDTLQPSKK